MKKFAKSLMLLKKKVCMEKNIWVSKEVLSLIDSNGKLIQEWRKVKVKGHVEDVLNSID